jgi:hypothetical protein
MKSTKTKDTQDAPVVPVRLTAAQIAVLGTLEAAAGRSTREIARRVLSIGLFALGLDPTGDFCLAEMTEAMHGKDSENAAKVFNAIVSAGDAARDTIVNAERATRRRVAKAVTGPLPAALYEVQA